jgi:uncharacterized protein YbjQ (UPF0145 family)
MGKKEEEEKADLTALEDIGHYLHQLNPDVEKKLTHGKKETVGGSEEPTATQATPEAPPEELPTAEPEPELPTEQFATETPSAETEEFKTEEPIEPTTEEPFAIETPSATEEIVPPTEAPIEALATEEAPPIEEPIPEETPVPEEKVEEVAPAPSMEAQPEGAGESKPEKPKEPEKFEEVKEFGKNISTTTAAVPGNPPFSIIIKNINFSEDADDILASLKEFGIAKPTNENIFKQGLESGSILITQLAESTAILLVHKFRQYDLEIEMGLSEEIHPSKTREKKGLVSRRNLYQNKSENVDLNIPAELPKEIPISTTPTLENFIINRYIGIVSEHSMVPESEIDKTPWEEKYAFLANQLKNKAAKLRGNAIVGVSFQLTPVDPTQYKLTCTGNVVWVSPSKENTI